MFNDVTFAPNAPLLSNDSAIRALDLGNLTVLTWIPDAQSNWEAAKYEAEFEQWHGLCYRKEHNLEPYVQLFLSTEPI